MLRKTEVDFLLDCLSGNLEPGQSLDAPQGLEWDEFMELSSRQGVAAILYKQFQKARLLEDLPQETIHTLKRVYIKNSARHLLFSAELGRILKFLNAEDIPVIALKGTHLANQIYSDPSLRPMSDIDILVKEGDAEKAFSGLVELGYRRASKEADEDHHHLPGLLSSSGIRVEIHTGIHEHGLPYAIDLEGIWERAVPTELMGAKAFVLSPEDLLLHLCVHAASHNFDCELRHLWDVREFFDHFQGEIDQATFGARARQWKVEKAAYVTLQLARELLKIDIPQGLTEEVFPSDFRHDYIDWAKEQLFSDANLNTSNFGKLNKQAGGGLISLCWNTLFIPRENLAKNYRISARSPKIHFYYLVRLKDLLVQYGPSVVKRFRYGDDQFVIANRENSNVLWKWLGS